MSALLTSIISSAYWKEGIFYKGLDVWIKA